MKWGDTGFSYHVGISMVKMRLSWRHRDIQSLDLHLAVDQSKSSEWTQIQRTKTTNELGHVRH
jgi:hypothetical protein